MKQSFTQEVIELIRDIPKGKVSTYGRIAELAGNPRAARHVVRVLSSCSEKESLPWWRVVNREGQIALKPGHGMEEQQDLLEAEAIEFGTNDRIDFSRFLWEPDWEE